VIVHCGLCVTFCLKNKELLPPTSEQSPYNSVEVGQAMRCFADKKATQNVFFSAPFAPVRRRAQKVGTVARAT